MSKVVVGIKAVPGSLFEKAARAVDLVLTPGAMDTIGGVLSVNERVTRFGQLFGVVVDIEIVDVDFETAFINDVCRVKIPRP